MTSPKDLSLKLFCGDSRDPRLTSSEGIRLAPQKSEVTARIRRPKLKYMYYTYSGLNLITVTSVTVRSNERWEEVEFKKFINHDVDGYPIQVKTNNDNDGGIWIKI